VGEVISLSRERLTRQLRGSTGKAALEARIDELLEILQRRNCPHIMAEILILRDAIWQLEADDPVHHRNHALPDTLLNASPPANQDSRNGNQ
jgi:hypothetical protein